MIYIVTTYRKLYRVPTPAPWVSCTVLNCRQPARYQWPTYGLSSTSSICTSHFAIRKRYLSVRPKVQKWYSSYVTCTGFQMMNEKCRDTGMITDTSGRKWCSNDSQGQYDEEDAATISVRQRYLFDQLLLQSKWLSVQHIVRSAGPLNMQRPFLWLPVHGPRLEGWTHAAKPLEGMTMIFKIQTKTACDLVQQTETSLWFCTLIPSRSTTTACPTPGYALAFPVKNTCSRGIGIRADRKRKQN